MANNKIDLGSAQDFVHELDQINQKLQQAIASARQFAEIMGKGGATPGQQAQFVQSVQQIQALQAAASTIQGSATVTGQQVIQAANLATGAGIVNRANTNPQGFASAIQSLGLQGAAFVAAANLSNQATLPTIANSPAAAQVVSSIINNAQAQALGARFPSWVTPNQVDQVNAVAAQHGLDPSQMTPDDPVMAGLLNVGGRRRGVPGYSAGFSPLPGNFSFGSGPGGGGYSLIGVGAALNAPLPPQYNTAAAINAGYAAANARLLSFGSAVGGSLAALGGQYVTSSIDYATERLRRGGVDYITEMGNSGALAGGLAGLGVGALSLNPVVAAGAALLGSQIGGAAGRLQGARQQNIADSYVAQLPLSVLGGGGAYYAYGRQRFPDFYPRSEESGGAQVLVGDGMRRSARFEEMAHMINMFTGGAGAPSEAARISGTALASSYTDIGQALYAGGRNPFDFDPTGIQYGPNDPKAAAKAYRERISVKANGIQGLVNLTVDKLRGVFDDQYNAIIGAGRGTIADSYVNRLGLLFGNQIDIGTKQVAPIFASEPEHGNRVADMLMQFGAQNTYTRLRIENWNLQSPVSEKVLREANAGIRRAGTQAVFGGLLPTGSGAAQQAAYQGQMDIIASLPDGKNSLVYAQAYANMRNARFASFGQEDLAGFGLRDLALQGQQQRLNYMPFAPGNIFANSLGIISNNMRQIGVLQNRLSLTDLSEQQRYQLEAQRQGLMTDNARNVGLLSEGFENRLPALAAGRPAFFGRYNSLQGAALNLGRMGSVIRAFGAANGAQAGFQDAFVNSFNVPGSSGPYSQTAGLNATLPVLEHIASTLDKIAGGNGRVSGNRPSDAYGAVAGSQDTKLIGETLLYRNRQ